MKKIFSQLFLSAFALLIITSCSNNDSSTSPIETTGSFFNMKVGSYWTYTSHDYNSDGTINESTLSYDSLVVTSTEQLWGKTAYNVSEFSTNDAGVMTKDLDYAYSYADGKLYVSSSFLDFKSMLPFDINYTFPTDQWFLLADQKGTTWSVLPSAVTIDEQDLPIPGYSGAKISGEYQIYMKKLANDSTLVNGTKVNTMNFELRNNITGNIKVTYIGVPLTIPFEINLIYNLSFGDGIGMIKKILPNQKVSITYMSQALYSYDVVGFESIIKSYVNNL
jgi:hypothetical protein